MWTSTNYFLVNLSITDLLLTVLNGLFNFIYMRDNNWIFGDIYCTINNFVAYVTVAASVLTLTAITLDRYVIYRLPTVITNPGSGRLYFFAKNPPGTKGIGQLLFSRFVTRPSKNVFPRPKKCLYKSLAFCIKFE